MTDKEILNQIYEMQKEMNRLMENMTEEEKYSLIYDMDDAEYELKGRRAKHV